MSKKHSKNPETLKKVISISLSGLMLFSPISPLLTTSYAQTQAGPTDSSTKTDRDASLENLISQGLIQSIPADSPTDVNPTSPVIISVPNTKDMLDKLHINPDGTSIDNSGKDKFGIVLVSGLDTHLATLSNGEITVKVTPDTITVTATHPTLTRYTNYSAYLIYTDSFNKYQELMSHPDLKIKGYMDWLNKVNADGTTIPTTSFETGSDIGEPTHWEIGEQNNGQPSVLKGATIDIFAKDDYGNMATSGSVTVVDNETTDNTELSDTYKIPSSVDLVNGHAQLHVDDHKAQTVETRIQTTGSYPEQDNKILKQTMAFQPGPAHTATMTEDTNSLVAGKVAKISGNVVDVYGNIVKPTVIDFSATDGTASATTTDDQGNYVTNFNAPTKMNQSNDLTEGVTVSMKSETGDATNQAVFTISPDVPLNATMQMSDSSIVAGKTYQVSGTVTDQFGNFVLPSSLDFVSSVGTIDVKATTDSRANYVANYTAPTKLTQGTDLKEAVKVSVASETGSAVNNVNFEISPDVAHTATIVPDKTSVVAGKSTHVSGNVLDQYGNIILPDTMNISASNGSIDASVVTDNQGHYVANYVAPTSLSQTPGALNETVHFTVASTKGDASNATDITVTPDVPALANIFSDKSMIMAGETANISGIAKDQYNNTIPYCVFNMTATDGQVDNSATSDDNGNFKIVYTAPTKVNGSEDVSIQGKTTEGTAVGNVNVTIIPNIANLVTLQADKTSVFQNDTINLTGIVKDKYGNNVADGTPIDIFNGTNHIVTVQTTSGAISYPYAPGVVGSENLTAVAGDGISSTPVNITVKAPAVPSSLTLNASTTSVNQGGTVTLSGVVKDQYGNVVPDGTGISLFNGKTLITTVQTTGGNFSYTYTPTGSGVQSLTAQVANDTTVESSVVNINVQTDGILVDMGGAQHVVTTEDFDDTNYVLNFSGDFNSVAKTTYKYGYGYTYQQRQMCTWYSSTGKSVCQTYWTWDYGWGYGYFPDGNMLENQTTSKATSNETFQLNIPSDASNAHVSFKYNITNAYNASVLKASIDGTNFTTATSGSWATATSPVLTPGNHTLTITWDKSATYAQAGDKLDIDDVSLVYDQGNSHWTDTGINISTPNQLVKIVSTGAQAGNLVAKVGDNGASVAVGANGAFISGVTGELYLGPNSNTLAPGQVKSQVTVTDPAKLGLAPSVITLTSSQTNMYNDGTSKATINGQLNYGSYPVVGGTVNLTAVDGTISSTTTEGHGWFSAPFTVGSSVGTATVSASYETASKSVSINVQDINKRVGSIQITNWSGPNGNIYWDYLGSVPYVYASHGDRLNVSGRVLNTAGSPIANTSVQIVLTAGTGRNTTYVNTDANGNFSTSVSTPYITTGYNTAYSYYYTYYYSDGTATITSGTVSTYKHFYDIAYYYRSWY